MKVVVSVIGTAGRGTDAARITPKLYSQMETSLEDTLSQLNGHSVVLKSGGAAVADHLAVRAFLKHHPLYELDLRLPARWDREVSRFDTKTREGQISNYYHDKFRQATGIDSLGEINKAIQLGAKIYEYNGFKVRNLQVADCYLLIAYTFGTHSYSGNYACTAEHAGLKDGDGGTAHTWNNARNIRYGIHFNLG